MADPYTHRLRADRLPARKPMDIDLVPDAAARGRIAQVLELLDLPAVRLTGQVAPAPAGAWAFEGRLSGSVVQPCGITLAPVTTVVDEPVRRLWSPHADDPAELSPETEMPDDEVERLGSEIDLGAVLVEALVLALPPFPRAPGATLEADGSGPATEEDRRRPFAGLADLLKRGE